MNGVGVACSFHEAMSAAAQTAAPPEPRSSAPSTRRSGHGPALAGRPARGHVEGPGGLHGADLVHEQGAAAAPRGEPGSAQRGSEVGGGYFRPGSYGGAPPLVILANLDHLIIVHARDELVIEAVNGYALVPHFPEVGQFGPDHDSAS